jgi:hypothetical protein
MDELNGVWSALILTPAASRLLGTHCFQSRYEDTAPLPPEIRNRTIVAID